MQDDESFSALPERKGGVKVTINPDVVSGKGDKKNPPPRIRGRILKKIGNDILFRKNCSTICAGGLNFSVRNGKR